MVSGGGTFVHAQLAIVLSGIGQTSRQVEHGQSHPREPLLLQQQGPDSAGRTDLAAVRAAWLATRPVGHHLGRPKSFEPLLPSQRLQDVVRTGLETLAATDAHLQELLFRNAARRTHRQRPSWIVQAGAEGPGQPRQAGTRGQSGRQSGRGRQEPAPPDWGLAGRWVIDRFPVLLIPTVDERNRLGRADASAGLAERTVGGARREIRLDRIERTDLDALVAVDARRMDLAAGDSEQVAQRENGPRGTNVLAPKARTQKTQGQDQDEQAE